MKMLTTLVLVAAFYFAYTQLVVPPPQGDPESDLAAIVAAVKAEIKPCACAVPKLDPEPTPAPPQGLHVGIVGPSQVEIGEQVVLRVSEDSNATGYVWRACCAAARIEQHDNGRTMTFSTAKPGDYVFLLIGEDIDPATKPLIADHAVRVGPVTPPPPPVVDPPVTPPVNPPQPPVNPARPTSATFVYEKSLHPIPRGVMAALSKLNVERKGTFVGSVFDQDTVDGTGQVPVQYGVALEAAKQAGLPCLVVQAGNSVIRVVKNPTTEAHVLEAVK